MDQMTLTISSIFFLIALIVFVVAAVWSPPRGNLLAAGLAFVAAGLLIP